MFYNYYGSLAHLGVQGFMAVKPDFIELVQHMVAGHNVTCCTASDLRLVWTLNKRSLL